ncbi:hypothetical protein [Streptomyces sp. NPDC055794]
MIGPNGAGKTTLTDAIYLGHPGNRFPALPRPTSAALASTDAGVERSIDIAYSLADDLHDEGRFGRELHTTGHRRLGGEAESWSVSLHRHLGTVTSRLTSSPGLARKIDQFKLIYLPAWRHPLDELARREVRILVELLRARQQELHGSRNLVALRARASRLLEDLAKDSLIDAVEARVGEQLGRLSAGVSPQWPYVRGQVIDDTYLARVLEIMLAVIEGRSAARPLEVSGLGYVNLPHIAVTLAAIPDSTEGPLASTTHRRAASTNSRPRRSRRGRRSRTWLKHKRKRLRGGLLLLYGPVSRNSHHRGARSPSPPSAAALVGPLPAQNRQGAPRVTGDPHQSRD